ncbi:heavy metal translocating P-type ATPase [Leeuwenhoekiella parthenopeia]|uniref:Heavy metal translocating P-type ATPase metal-binding domain-containing protein n=1 Tax=Leeuwenhoekiella parthenopeia TaxID=2890320 RepID=A0ABS8GQ15_9FLAO|nr:heavy metal translocating P-type ATPase metal-binding domain-containing protein [Leeuwenhoekiella parthenopeia]MCC4212060.1 heavy metal translocating P-type ATPase metal-binding domain-containing protein [Leeuwenhoekiella parthenopeia]
MESCYHCGDSCGEHVLAHRSKFFCCSGCKTVYDILYENNLSYYYDLDKSPGNTPKDFKGRFDYLDNPEIKAKLLDFDEQATQIASFTIPAIHCSSCIWVLENLSKLRPAIKSTQVNFPEKTIRITFNSAEISLREVVELLCMLGYEPVISLQDFNKKERKKDRSLIYKLGIAGFAFGNIMFLSFPEYFEVEEFWLDRYKPIFRALMLVFSIPVVLYSARDYFTSAFKSLRSRMLNIDVPIALGILVLFLRSCYEVITNTGTGFFDSLAGLVFFLLLGKFFQQKTYAYLSFERDYKSYFPIAVTRLETEGAQRESQIPVYEIKPKDRILIRNGELIPVDGILIKGDALIDYSFVTGEAEPVSKKTGDTVFAGGKQQGGILELSVTKAVEQSYLTQLWSNEIFQKERQNELDSLTTKISKHFTLGVLGIALAASLFWWFVDPSKILHVFTAVLIVACPCALALSAPFTLGNLLRITGKHKFYLKDAGVIEQLAAVDTVVFDKTGTLTSASKEAIRYSGESLTEHEESLLTSTLRASNHPLSRSLYSMFQDYKIKVLDDFEEEPGMGITGTLKKQEIRVGSYAFVNALPPEKKQLADSHTSVHIATQTGYKGCYTFQTTYRSALKSVFRELSKNVELVILSGDNDSEQSRLNRLLDVPVAMHFNQKPEDKLKFIKSLQQQGKKVMMVGDGLNDSGALAQSDVGIAISENVNVFSPACDGILDASRFEQLPAFIKLARNGKRIIKWSFVLSLLYNVVGLALAVSGNLKPVYAAILMPLSSISIVAFTTLCTYYFGSSLKNPEEDE